MASKRRWRLRHVIAVVSAPLVLIAGGGFAYAWLSRPESVAVPNVVHRDMFTAASTLQKAGFEVDSIVTDNPRPAGVVLAQTPRRGLKADEGSTVTITVSDIVATVPEVVGTPVDDALAALRHVGFTNLPVTDDYRDDVEPGTVVSVTPTAYSEAKKTEPVSVSVARDPHVTVPNLVSTDQATATNNLQQLGLVVAVKNGSSSTVPAGNVISMSPGADRVLVRGDTVTLTVSTGPKLVKVPYVVTLVGRRRAGTSSKTPGSRWRSPPPRWRTARWATSSPRTRPAARPPRAPPSRSPSGSVRPASGRQPG